MYVTDLKRVLMYCGLALVDVEANYLVVKAYQVRWIRAVWGHYWAVTNPFVVHRHYLCHALGLLQYPLRHVAFFLVPKSAISIASLRWGSGVLVGPRGVGGFRRPIQWQSRYVAVECQQRVRACICLHVS